MRRHTWYCITMSGLFHLQWFPLVLPVCWKCQTAFLWLIYTLICLYTYFLSPSSDGCIADSMFWPSWVVLQGTWTCSCLLGVLLPFPLSVYMGAGDPGHIVVAILVSSVPFILKQGPNIENSNNTHMYLYPLLIDVMKWDYCFVVSKYKQDHQPTFPRQRM